MCSGLGSLATMTRSLPTTPPSERWHERPRRGLMKNWLGLFHQPVVLEVTVSQRKDSGAHLILPPLGTLQSIPELPKAL